MPLSRLINPMRLALLFVAVSTAQAAGLIANPSSVAWPYASGSHNYPTQYISLTSATGATSYSATATSENGWLLVNSAYVSSSSTMTAYLSTASPIDRLNSGNYQGTVNFTDASGNTTSLVVTLTVTGGGGTNGLTVIPSSLAFASPLGGPPQTQYLSVTGPTSGSLQVQAASGTMPDWLRPTMSGGAGSYVVAVTVAPSAVSAGTYAESLVLTIGASSATVPVRLTVQMQSALTATPQLLTFDYTLGGQPPNSQLIQVGSTNGAAILFSAASQVQIGNWLQIMPATATAPGARISVIPQNLSDLAPGFYSGSVIITPQAGAPLLIPVNLTVRAAPTIGVSADSISFAYRIGDAVPPPLPIQVTGGGAGPTFTVTNPSPDWLSITPSSGVAPANLMFAVKPSQLSSGTYNATVTVTGTGSAKGSATVTVTLLIVSANMTIAKAVNAASYQEGAIAPGEIVTIFGTNLNSGPPAMLTLDANGNVATQVNGLQVLFNGTAAPLIYGGTGQVSAVAPYELVGHSDATIQVVYNGQTSNALTVPVTTTAPGIFTADSSGTGTAAAIYAPAGGVITLYLTGEGQTAPGGVTGKVTTVSATPPLTPAPVLPVSLSIGGLPADYTFAGEAPGIVSGVLQLNAKVPSGLTPGEYPIVVSIGGKTSPTGVTVRVN